MEPNPQDSLVTSSGEIENETGMYGLCRRALKWWKNNMGPFSAETTNYR